MEHWDLRTSTLSTLVETADRVEITGDGSRLLVVDQDRDSPLEDVERIRVFPVEVRICSGAGVREKGLGDAELVEVRLDDDSSAEERLALAGSVHDSWHRCRV